MGLRQVIYKGPIKRFIGSTALQDGMGLVQLDGKEDWRMPPELREPLCYGWHEIKGEWEALTNG